MHNIWLNWWFQWIIAQHYIGQTSQTHSHIYAEFAGFDKPGFTHHIWSQEGLVRTNWFHQDDSCLMLNQICRSRCLDKCVTRCTDSTASTDNNNHLTMTARSHMLSCGVPGIRSFWCCSTTAVTYLKTSRYSSDKTLNDKLQEREALHSMNLM